MIITKPMQLTIIVIAAALVLFFAKDALSVIGTTGFSTLSLSNVQYISNDPFFNGPVYTLSVVADGSSGSLKGHFTSAQFAEFGLTNTPSGDFDVYIDILNETCTNTILNNTNKMVYSYSTSSVSRWDSNSGKCICYGSLPGEKTQLCSYSNKDGCVEIVGPATGSYSSSCKCEYTKKNVVGQVYELDTVNHYNSNIRVRVVTASGQTIETFLSPNSPSAELPGILKANFVGSLQGVQSCPTSAVNNVLFRAKDSASFTPKPKTVWQTLAGYSDVIPGTHTLAATVTKYVAAFLASSTTDSAYCKVNTVDGITTQYSCNPASPVALPLIKLQIKADTLGVVSPDGKPEILGAVTKNTEAGSTESIDVNVRNNGEADSFDVAIVGARQVNIQASRVSIAKGEMKTIPVLFQGSGIIGNYTIRVSSVNNPKNYDDWNFKLVIYPFCDKPEQPGRERVFTELGCYWICNQPPDVRELRCQPFGSFETQGMYNDNTIIGENPDGTPIFKSIVDPGETHCVGISKYMRLDSYMDDVYAKKMQPFVPQAAEHTYWIDGKICNYVAEYGYKWDGTQAYPVASSEFAYTGLPPTATEVETSSGGTTIVAQPAQPQLPLWWLIPVFAAIGVIGYLLVRKKK